MCLSSVQPGGPRRCPSSLRTREGTIRGGVQVRLGELRDLADSNRRPASRHARWRVLVEQILRRLEVLAGVRHELLAFGVEMAEEGEARRAAASRVAQAEATLVMEEAALSRDRAFPIGERGLLDAQLGYLEARQAEVFAELGLARAAVRPGDGMQPDGRPHPRRARVTALEAQVSFLVRVAQAKNAAWAGTPTLEEREARVLLADDELTAAQAELDELTNPGSAT